MLPTLDKIRGVHPGSVLKRELKIRKIKGTQLAEMLSEHKQTISAILNNRRAINPSLSIKLASQFNIDEDYFMMLQACYDVKQALEKQTKQTPNLSLLRKALFWDTTYDNIDWQKNKRAVIKRVLERGNDQEINEIISFYGKQVVMDEVKLIGESRLAAFDENIHRFHLV